MPEFAPNTQPTDDIHKVVGRMLSDHRAELGDSDAHHQEHAAAIQALLHRMYEISDEPAGAEPADYFEPDDVATLMSFADIMDHMGWPEAGALDMRVGRLGSDIWKSGHSTAKHPLFNWTRTQKIDRGNLRGYQFAQFGTIPTQQIAFGNDRKLYSLRSHELSHSKGSGWGALPEPDLVLAALSKGHTMFDLYGRGSGSGTVATSLTLTLDAEHARQIRGLIGHPE